MNSIMKSNFLGKFRAAAARYLFPSQYAAAAAASPAQSAAASPAQSAAVALSPLRSDVDVSSSYKPPSTWGFVDVDNHTAFVIERFGKHAKALYPGYNFLIPFVDKIAYVQSLKLRIIDIPGEDAITKDDVPVRVSSSLFYQIFDPVLASYRVENSRYSVKQLARTMMLTEIGKMTCKEAFDSQAIKTLSGKMKIAIDAALKEWGLECKCYSLDDITLPADVIKAIKRKNFTGNEETIKILNRKVWEIEGEQIVIGPF